MWHEGRELAARRGRWKGAYSRREPGVACCERRFGKKRDLSLNRGDTGGRSRVIFLESKDE